LYYYDIGDWNGTMSGELDLFSESVSNAAGTQVLFLDTETTGADPETAEVCELALLLATYAGFDRDQSADSLLEILVKPSSPVPPEASAIHHITNRMLADRPAIADIAGSVRELVDRADFVCAHNLAFDLTILKRELPDVFGSVTPTMELDSLRLARHIWPAIPSHALQALRYRYELDAGLEGDAHRALFDTVLVRSLVEHVLGAGLTDCPDWNSLAEFCRSPLDIQTFSFGKYRGKLVEDIAAEDADYIRWLLRQKWLTEEYPDLYHTLLKKIGGKK
jgi:exodeoxyribonuclease X